MANPVWSTELLVLLHAPLTPQNYQFVNQWATREHNGGPALSDGSNNPFFTTAGAGGTVGPFKAGTFPSWNSIGVAKYPNIETGTYINAYHIATQYPAIANALRSGNPGSQSGNQEFQRELTTWSGGGYSGFASIPAVSGPVGPTVDTAAMAHDIAGLAKGAVPKQGGGGGIGGVVGGIAGGVNSAARHIPGVAQAEGAVSAAEGVASFLGKLTDPHYILRGLQVVAGAGLVVIGLTLLARQVALAADLPDPLLLVTKGVAGKTGGGDAAAFAQGQQQVARSQARAAGRAQAQRSTAVVTGSETRESQRAGEIRRQANAIDGDIPF